MDFGTSVIEAINDSELKDIKAKRFGYNDCFVKHGSVEEVESKNLDFFDTVNEATCKLLKYRKEKDFLNIISKEAEWLKNPIIIKNLTLIDTQIQNYIKSKLQKAKEKGFIEFTDLDVTSFLVYKMYMALILEWTDKDKTMDEQMIANSISEIIKKGLRKE